MRPSLFKLCGLAAGLAAGLAITLPCAAGTDGAAVYQQICVACHQAGAVGAPGLAPSLVGELSRRADRPAVRAYMAQVVVQGLQGPIVSEGQSYNSVMPSQAQLSDDELAAVLTHVVVGLGGQAQAAPFKPEDISAARATRQSPKALRAQREAALGG